MILPLLKKALIRLFGKWSLVPSAPPLKTVIQIYINELRFFNFYFPTTILQHLWQLIRHITIFFIINRDKFIRWKVISNWFNLSISAFASGDWKYTLERLRILRIIFISLWPVKIGKGITDYTTTLVSWISSITISIKSESMDSSHAKVKMGVSSST